MSDKPCCNCGYNGQEETSCFAREDKLHCECWYDGDSATEHPTLPHALTREQVIGDIRECVEMTALKPDLSAPQDPNVYISQQRQALAQQAQEIERLKRDNRLLNEHITCCRAENAEKLSQLAAMTAERDEACGELLVSLDDAPIGSLAGKLVTANRVLRSHLATLQATLAERDAYKAVLQGAEYEQVDKIGTLSVEVAQRIGVTAAHRTKEIVAQLAASQARCREMERLAYLGDHHFPDLTWKARCEETAEDLRQLQATLAEREEEVSQLNTVLREAGWGQGEIDSAAYTFDKLAQANRKLVAERDAAAQEAGRLREVLDEFFHYGYDRNKCDKALKGQH